MLTIVHRGGSPRDRRRSNPSNPPPTRTVKRRAPVRGVTQNAESDSAHWKQMVEAEARHRLKRALGPRPK